VKAAGLLALEIQNHTIVLLHDYFFVWIVDSGYLRGNISESFTRLKDELIISVRYFANSKGPLSFFCFLPDSIETHECLSWIQSEFVWWVCW